MMKYAIVILSSIGFAGLLHANQNPSTSQSPSFQIAEANEFGDNERDEWRSHRSSWCQEHPERCERKSRAQGSQWCQEHPQECENRQVIRQEEDELRDHR